MLGNASRPAASTSPFSSKCLKPRWRTRPHAVKRVLDDLYAPGVTLLCLLLGRDLLGNVEPARHVDDRIATGSTRCWSV